MGFLFFLILNVLLYVRPEELIEDLAGTRLYLIAITLCTLFSGHLLLRFVDLRNLIKDPITCLVFLYFSCFLLSDLPRGRINEGVDAASEFLKTILYYLLLLANVNNRVRFDAFIQVLVLCILVNAGLGMLQYEGFINIPTLQPVFETYYDPITNSDTILYRMCGSGIFSDPNDICTVMVVGAALSAYLVFRNVLFIGNWIWFLPIAIFGYGLTLTHSRGGFLAFVAAALGYFVARYGKRVALIPAIVTLPIMFALFAGRTTNIELGSGTSAERLALWSGGFEVLKRYPLFGSGSNTYIDEVGQVAHNSFVHSFVEFGFYGGIVYAGMFYAAGMGLLKWKPSATIGSLSLKEKREADLDKLYPFLSSAFVGYTVGTLSLSRNLNLPTYTVLGLVNAFLLVHPSQDFLRFSQVNFNFAKRCIITGILVFAFHKALIVMFYRPGG